MEVLSGRVSWIVCSKQHVSRVTDLTGLYEVVVVVMHCLPDLVCAVCIHRRQISSQLIYALFCHALSSMRP
jgi:hypothetical protein